MIYDLTLPLTVLLTNPASCIAHICSPFSFIFIVFNFRFIHFIIPRSLLIYRFFSFVFLLFPIILLLIHNTTASCVTRNVLLFLYLAPTDIKQSRKRSFISISGIFTLFELVSHDCLFFKNSVFFHPL